MASSVYQRLGRVFAPDRFSPDRRALLKAAAFAGAATALSVGGCSWTREDEGDDGEGAENCKGETVKQTVDRVTAVDDARVYLSKGDLGHKACMYFVLGNSPWEVMADCSSYPEWDADLKLVEEAANLEGL